MATLTQIRASNAQLTVDTVPKTVVFVGATDGIGKATLTELVSKGFPVNVFIVGRNEVAHRPLLEELRLLNSKAHLVYLEGQISLLAEAARLADEIAQREQEIDALILSPGFLPFLGRQETDEGVELSMAVAYYSRIVFISRLLPQLRAAAGPNSNQYSPRIISILGAGKETADLFLDDLTLKEPGRFNIPNYVGHVGTMSFVAMKRLAEAPENKDVVFVYAHPGIVMTDLVKKSWGGKWDDKAASQAAPPSRDFVRATPKESGERSLYLVTSAEYGGNGAPLPSGRVGGLTINGLSQGSLFSVSDGMETLHPDKLLADLQKTGATDKIWEHIQKIAGVHLL